MTQAERIIAAIRAAGRRGLTWGDIEALRISTCPWVRVAESGHRFLKRGEKLERRQGDNGLVRLVIARG